MLKRILNFIRREDGAVTVDWVVLTAAIVALAIAVFTVIQTPTQTLAGNAATAIADSVPDY